MDFHAPVLITNEFLTLLMNATCQVGEQRCLDLCIER